MNYGFVRMVLKEVPPQERAAAIAALSKRNLELYCKKADGTYALITDASDCTDGNICVSAADWEQAVQAARAEGFEKWLCSEKESVVAESPLDAAEKEYYRKRKIGQIECAVVVVLVVLYMLIKNVFQ